MRAFFEQLIIRRKLHGKNLVFLLHARLNDDTIADNLGITDYSYYFVLKRFEPLLAEYGRVTIIKEPSADIDKLQLDPNEQPIYVSFTPPHLCYIPQSIPCICVFAWEYGSLPSETFGADPMDDWVATLSRMDGCITHSSFAADQVRDELGATYPIASIPAPLWDDYCKSPSVLTTEKLQQSFTLKTDGAILHATYDAKGSFVLNESIADSHCKTVETELSGVIYTTVTNLNDGRKNWTDAVTAFCYALRDKADATLIVKSTYHEYDLCRDHMLDRLSKLRGFRCNVVFLHGFLDNDSYDNLMTRTHYAVNSSRGEGQCLPLMEFMSAGKPAVTPRHSAMLDYVNENNAFVVYSSLEWTNWPHDPRLFLRTLRSRISWESLEKGYKKSYDTAIYDRPRYNMMSLAAKDSLQHYCSLHTAHLGLQQFLQTLLSSNENTHDNT